MNNINAFIYNSKGELIMLSTLTPIQKGNVVKYNDKFYEATDVRNGINTLSRKGSKIVELKEWKDKK